MLKDNLESLLWSYLHTVTLAHDNQPNEPYKQVIFKDELPELIAKILTLMEEESANNGYDKV